MLVDTSAWVEFLRHTGSFLDASLARALRDGLPLAITGVVVQEVLQGCRGGEQARDVLRLLAACRVADAVFPATYQHAAMLYRRCRHGGRTVRGTVDCLVAAIALEHNLPLLAADRDFVTLHDVCGLALVRAEP